MLDKYNNINLKIFTAYSFDCPTIPQHENTNIYKRFGCGGYVNNVDFSDKMDDRISKINKYINEMTMIYWVGTHYDEVGNPEYIGFDHYRRVLSFNLDMLKENNILCHKDIMDRTVYNHYAEDHTKYIIDRVINIFNEEFPTLKDAFHEFLNQNETYICNMFIMHRDAFCLYSKYINKCVDMIYKMIIPEEIDKLGNYQLRAYAFMLERLTSFWIYFNVKNKSYKHIQCYMYVYNIISKYR